MLVTGEPKKRRRRKRAEIPVQLTCYSIQTISEALAMSPESVARYMDEGRLPGFQTRGGWKVTHANYERFFCELSGQEMD